MPSEVRPRRRQTLAILVLIGSLGIFGVAVFVTQRLHQHHSGLALTDRISGSDRSRPAGDPRTAGGAAAASATASHSELSASQQAEAKQIDAATAIKLKTATRQILIVGASYTQGLGASTPQHGYAYLLSGKLGWTETVAGVAGTGFLNPGPRKEGTFGQRIAKLPPTLKPGLVLVQCGRNDANYPPAALRLSVQTTIKLLRARFPEAALTFLGPIPGSMPIGANVLREQKLLATVSSQEKVPFIDPISENWITTANLRGYTGDVPGHPDDVGYGYIADRLVADLQGRLGITPHPNPVTPGAVSGNSPTGSAAGATDAAVNTGSRSTAATPRPVAGSAAPGVAGASAAAPQDAGTRRP